MNVASRCQWVFGTAAAGLNANNVLGSTGGGAAFNTHGWGLKFTFSVETDAASTCSYQIRSGRTSIGPWSILSSGTLSTGACDTVHVDGPLFWLSPRIKTINSTANQVLVRMAAVD